jgi:hypothetical protein
MRASIAAQNLGILMLQTAPVGKTISIMQPYFIPYAGYFRLLVGADVFVIYDCVQFQRRGWTHRNVLRTANGTTEWLTLPLEKAPQDVLIRDLRFRSGARKDIEAQIPRFPALSASSPRTASLVDAIRDPSGRPVDYIIDLLRLTTEIMGLPWRVVRSSELGLPSDLRGQDRILAIVKACAGSRYINPPGGRKLYHHADFAEAGIELYFLKDHMGSYDSIVQRLSAEDPIAVAKEIRANTIWAA